MPTDSVSTHFGLILPNYGPLIDRDDLVACTIAAEDSGWGSAWATDHVMCPTDFADVYGDISEALVTIAYLAAKAERIALGVSALIVPARNPLVALKQLASLDFLTGGRIVTAVAVGWMQQEFETLRSDFEDRGRLLDEWLDLARTVFEQTPGALHFDGSRLRIVNAYSGPALERPGGPEIWVAGYSDVTLKRAAKTGVWHPSGPAIDDLARMTEKFKALRLDGKVVPRLGVQMGAAAGPHHRPKIKGDLDEIEAGLRSYLDAGCDGFCIDLGRNTPGLADRVRRFGEEVIPRFV